MFVKFEAHVLCVFNFNFLLILFFDDIFIHVCDYASCVCIVLVEYVRSTMQIGRSHLCDYFFITYFQYEIMRCE